MNEFDIIRDYFAPLAKGAQGALELTDDAAVLDIPKSFELAVTTDAIVEGVHFTGEETPDLIARKLLRMNLSDLAAMGAVPYGYFLAAMLPKKTDAAWMEAFAQGLGSDQKTFSITLLGGDTTQTPGPLSLSLTALGLVPAGQALKRSGAQPGDDVYVSGTIGDAALGLQVATHKLQADAYLLGRYQLPQPRVGLGKKLLGIAHACMDISDGLMQDLSHIAAQSDVSVAVFWEDIPLSDAARDVLPHVKNPHEVIAAGGDDYELLFTAPPDARTALQKVAQECGMPVTRIGNIKQGQGIKLIDKNGEDIYLARQGYNHFQKRT